MAQPAKGMYQTFSPRGSIKHTGSGAITMKHQQNIRGLDRMNNAIASSNVQSTITAATGNGANK
jgi:hypothetical protein